MFLISGGWHRVVVACSFLYKHVAVGASRLSISNSSVYYDMGRVVCVKAAMPHKTNLKSAASRVNRQLHQPTIYRCIYI